MALALAACLDGRVCSFSATPVGSQLRHRYFVQVRQPSQAVDAMKTVMGRVTGWKGAGWPDLPWYVTSGAANLRGRWWFSRRDKEQHRCAADSLLMRCSP